MGTVRVEALGDEAFGRVPLLWISLHEVGADDESVTWVENDTADLDLLGHGADLGYGSWCVSAQDLLVAHLDVLEILDLLKSHLIHHVVMYPLHKGINLLSEALIRLRLVDHGRDEVSRGTLYCLGPGNEEYEHVINDVLSLLIALILKQHFQKVSRVRHFRRLLLVNDLPDEVAQLSTILYEAPVSGKHFGLHGSHLHEDQWILRDASHDVAEDKVHELAERDIAHLPSEHVLVLERPEAVLRADQN